MIKQFYSGMNFTSNNTTELAIQKIILTDYELLNSYSRIKEFQITIKTKNSERLGIETTMPPNILTADLQLSA